MIKAKADFSVAMKFKWEDIDYREYLEVTTKCLQYHWTGPRDKDGCGYSRWLVSAGRSVGSQEKPWIAEIKSADEWVFVGEFRTGREAKAAAIKAFIATTRKIS